MASFSGDVFQAVPIPGDGHSHHSGCLRNPLEAAAEPGYQIPSPELIPVLDPTLEEPQGAAPALPTHPGALRCLQEL